MKNHTNCSRCRSAGIVLVSTLALLTSVQNGPALTIIRDFIGGAPGTNDIGSGNVVEIFNAAADIWELAIRDQHVLTLHFGWAPVGGGEHTLIAQGGTPNRETEGTILFNNDNSPIHYHYYLDPTPYDNEEFGNYMEETINLGGGPVNATRVFKSGPASFDLLTTALHEIGHALGMSTANTTFIAESADLDIDVTAPRPFAGTTIPLQSNMYGVTSHIDYVAGRILMAGSYAPGERGLPSVLDIIALAQLCQFSALNVNLVPTLDITALGANVTVRWPQPLVEFMVEQNTDLRQTNAWSTVEFPVVMSNGLHTVRLPVTTGKNFFRLRKRGS